MSCRTLWRGKGDLPCLSDEGLREHPGADHFFDDGISVDLRVRMGFLNSQEMDGTDIRKPKYISWILSLY